MQSEELTSALGRALTAVWGDLPPGIQHEIFEAAVRLSGEVAREDLAKLLHRAHPRTTDNDKARAMPEPDSLGG